MSVLPGKAQRAFRRLRGEEARIRALRILIVILLVVALGTVIRTSWNGLPGPELTIETCSFLAALLVVLAQHGAERRALRRRAIENIASELAANASELTSGELMRTGSQLQAAMDDHGDGLRYYYSHLATTATRGAILSGALDGRQDRELVERLTQWVHDCEACNRRFMMSELRLFSTGANESGVRERARIHVSIVSGPAARQRAGLKEVADFLIDLGDRDSLPKQLSPLLARLKAAVEGFEGADAISVELRRQFGLAGLV